MTFFHTLHCGHISSHRNWLRKQTILDEIAWPGLVKCVTGTEDEFDGNWESMVQELTDNGLADAEEAMTEFLATKLVDVE